MNRQFIVGLLLGSFVSFFVGLGLSDNVILLKGRTLDLRAAETRLSGYFEEEVDFSRLIEVLATLHSRYYLSEGESIDIEKLMDKAVVGMVQGLDDKHTVYMLPDETKSFRDSLNGELQGIGAELRRSNEIVEVVTVLKGTPAEGVGLLPGDFIISVDDTEIEGKPFYDVIMMIRGEKGSEVVLDVLRDGRELTFNIIRDRIIVESVETSMDGDIGIIEINNFGMKTSVDFKNALEEMKEKEVAGLVIDLRYNPGGVLVGAVNMISQFFPEGELLVTRRSQDREDEYRSVDPAFYGDLPVVLLVNKGSASASEIFAGVFQDLMRGKVIGEDTFGKGSVQEPIDFSDGRMLKLTTSRWYTPLGRTIDQVGVIPDIHIERTKEDVENDVDPQLEKALEVVRGDDWRQLEPPSLEVSSGSVSVSAGSVSSDVITIQSGAVEVKFK